MQNYNMLKQALRKKCPYSELFWSAFSRIRSEYREILRIFPYSVRMRENANQNNSEYGHFSRSERLVYLTQIGEYGTLLFHYLKGHTFMASTKNDQFCDPSSPSIRKNEQQICCLKNRIRKHVTKTPAHPFPCERY